jgi:hypothetical protein
VKIVKELQADVMALAVSKDMIYASGVDSKVISLRLVKEDSTALIGAVSEGANTWIYAGSL